MSSTAQAEIYKSPNGVTEKEVKKEINKAIEQNKLFCSDEPGAE